MDILTPVPLPSTTITKATIDDLPALAQTAMMSHISEAIIAFFFPSWPRTNEILPYYTSRVKAKLLEPNSEFFKMVDDNTGEMVGIVCMTHEAGKEISDRKLLNPDGSFEPPKGFNFAFAGAVLGGLASLDAVMVGREHYMLSSLAINPSHQKKGLGRELMLYCHERAARQGLPIYLTAFPGAHDLYLKLGYADKMHFDVDLNEWGTKFRGFGVYRSYGMLWEPEKEGEEIV